MEEVAFQLNKKSASNDPMLKSKNQITLHTQLLQSIFKHLNWFFMLLVPEQMTKGQRKVKLFIIKNNSRLAVTKFSGIWQTIQQTWQYTQVLQK